MALDSIFRGVKNPLAHSSTSVPVKFKHNTVNRNNENPIFKFTTSVASPITGNLEVYSDYIYISDLPLTISSSSHSGIGGSCIWVDIPDLNLEEDHVRINIDKNHRLVLEHNAKGPSGTKVMYMDFVEEDYSIDSLVRLDTQNSANTRLCEIITSPEFKIISGFVETEIELFPEIKRYINDNFAIMGIKKCNIDTDFDCAPLCDPVDEQVVIGTDVDAMKVCLRSGYHVGRHTQAHVYFPEIAVARAGFYVILKGDNPFIHSYVSKTFSVYQPDGSLVPFEKSGENKFYTGLTFTDGAYDYCVLDFCNGFDFKGKRAKAQAAASAQPVVENSDNDNYDNFTPLFES